MSDSEPTLPYESKKQIAVLGHLLSDQKFFMQAVDRIKPGWFTDVYVAKLYQTKVELFEQLHRPPTLFEVLNCKEIQSAEQKTRNKLNDIANVSQEICKEYGLDLLARELTDWLKAVIFEDATRKSIALYNAKKSTEAVRLYEETARKITDASFFADREITFDDHVGDVSQLHVELTNAITTGCRTLDLVLCPEAEGKGGLLPGDSSLIVAATNSGKTTSMITTIAANLKRGKKVLWIPVEDRVLDLKTKLWCCLLGCTKSEYLSLYTPNNPNFYKLDILVKIIKDNLVFIPMQEAGLTVEEAVAVVREQQERLAIKNNGKGFDLLVVDYPAAMTTARASKGNLQKREEDAIAYFYFQHLAKEYAFHALLPIQTNREGSKINNLKGRGGQGTDRQLVKEDVSESWGPGLNSANIWTLNRPPIAIKNNWMALYVDKCRGNSTGISVICQTDFSHCTAYSDEMKSIKYHGMDAYSDKVTSILNDSATGTEVASTEISKYSGD